MTVLSSHFSHSSHHPSAPHPHWPPLITNIGRERDDLARAELWVSGNIRHTSPSPGPRLSLCWPHNTHGATGSNQYLTSYRNTRVTLSEMIRFRFKINFIFASLQFKYQCSHAFTPWWHGHDCYSSPWLCVCNALHSLHTIQSPATLSLDWTVNRYSTVICTVLRSLS